MGRLFEAMLVALSKKRTTHGAIIVAVAGLLWAGLCMVLYLAGHAPSVVLVPIGRADYYLAQAVMVVPLLPALWWLMATVTARVVWHGQPAGAVHPDQRRHLFVVLAYAYALPIALGLLLPDIVVYAWGGHALMTQSLRYYAPIAPLLVIALAVVVTRRVAGVSLGRALLGVLAGALAQGVVAGALLR